MLNYKCCWIDTNVQSHLKIQLKKGSNPTPCSSTQELDILITESIQRQEAMIIG